MPHRPISVISTRILSLSLLLLLGACAQQRQPGYYDVPRGNTTSDAIQRAQGDSSTLAPSQLQFGFGAQDQKRATPAPVNAPTATPGTAAHAPATTARAPLPEALAETRTYLGTLPCPDSSVCSATRMTLTLAPDGQWRARNAAINSKGPAQTALGCWFLAGTNPIRIVLQSGEQPYATLELVQSNTLRLTRWNGAMPLLDSHLTRQADIDPIDELSSHPAQACAAH